jgi:hypothetical protein
MSVINSRPASVRRHFRSGRSTYNKLVTRLPFRPIAPVALALLLIVCVPRPAWTAQEFEVQTVSSRSDTVSGNDVLVRLSAPTDSKWIAQLDGRDVTQAFHPAKGSGSLLALLTGLKNGKNTLEIRVSGAIKYSLEIGNHPLAGPIFSGPHQEPFICQTVLNGLGPALDADCDAKTVVQYYYKPAQPARQDAIASMITSLQIFVGKTPVGLPAGFKSYDPSSPPTDVAQTATSDGRTVPYIVRREIGVINRAVYDIRFLHQPGQPLSTPWTGPAPGWNGRLVYELAGGCAAGYRQGNLLATASHEGLLAQGYAVAASTLNIFGNNCNDVLSAETLSMVKEHFVKSFGEPIHTIGWGDSGGSMQLYLTSQNYPGLLDGIIPYISFPDIVTYVPSTSDCSLLTRAFGKLKQPLTDEQKSAIVGFVTWRTCSGLDDFAISARNCNSTIPQAKIYDAADRPQGVRCDIYDNEINVLGRDPSTGFARRPLDNIGVEYGLTVFHEGKIDTEQFVELNEQVGGFDADGNVVPKRTQADREALLRAYQLGLVLTGGGGLRDTPIIDWRWYSDDLGDNHDSFRSFVTRARLIAANGNAANQVILIDARASTFQMTLSRVGDPNLETSLFARRERDLVQQMDHWLDNIAADRAAGTPAEKVRRDRPSDLSDTCWATDGEKITGAAVYGGRCSEIYPQHSDPRIAAGGPMTDDVLKCALKPISAADYSPPLSAGQLDRLRAVFPAGVCDYSRPGVGQQMTNATWQRY